MKINIRGLDLVKEVEAVNGMITNKINNTIKNEIKQRGCRSILKEVKLQAAARAQK